MGSFVSKTKTKKKPAITSQPTVDAILVNDAVATIRTNIPDCIVTTIALKDEDVYVPQTLGLNHYVVTYDAVSQRVIRVYSDA
jgi:hypothetical protein